MNSKDESDKVLQIVEMVKKNFPELYQQHLGEGRRDQFISENVPPDGKSHGRKIGYIGKDLRLLWALMGMFEKLSLNSTFLGKEKICGESEAYQAIYDSTLLSLELLCWTIFWELVKVRFMIRRTRKNYKKYALCLRPDWSVILVRNPEARSALGILLTTAEIQAEIGGYAMYAKECINDEE